MFYVSDSSVKLLYVKNLDCPVAGTFRTMPRVTFLAQRQTPLYMHKGLPFHRPAEEGMIK